MKVKVRVSGPASKGGMTAMNSGYADAGASIIKRSLKAFTPRSGSPVEDIDWNNATLRQRSRMLYMSAPVATSAINTARTKAVGLGLKVQPAPDTATLGISEDDASAWARQVETEFSMWAGDKNHCDALGLNNFYAIQQLAFLSWFQSGDVFAVIQREKADDCPYTLRLHLIEADRVSTPTKYRSKIKIDTEGAIGEGNKIHDGIEVNAVGKVVAYHIADTYPMDSLYPYTKWTRVEAYGEKTKMPNILHVMSAERPDQYRGVPFLSKVVEPLLQLRRYTESELMAALVQSFFTAFIKTSTDPSQLPFASPGPGNTMGVPSGNPVVDETSGNESDYELGPAMINVLEPNEDVTLANPNIPTAGFDNFVKCICKEIGASLEIPYDILLKEFNASYSASRAALLEMWEAVKMWRSWFISDFTQPVYEMWLAEAVARGRIKAPGFFDEPLIKAAWCSAQWIGPTQGSLDPLKEANAAIALIDRGIKTHGQVTREMTGGDWNENITQLSAELQLLPTQKTEVSVEEDEDDDEL